MLNFMIYSQLIDDILGRKRLFQPQTDHIPLRIAGDGWCIAEEHLIWLRPGDFVCRGGHRASQVSAQTGNIWQGKDGVIM